VALSRIGRGDEDAMAAFYRAHGRVVLTQILLVTGERVVGIPPAPWSPWTN